METEKLSSDSVVKLCWNLAFIAIALMVTKTLLNIVSFYVGLPQ